MSWLITPAAKATQAKQATKVNGVPIQSSVIGSVIPIVFGTTRISANLIWYGDFQKHKQSGSTGSQSAGKGGLLSGGAASGSTTTTTYSASFAFALCEGPITGVPTVYDGSHKHTLSDESMGLFNGAYQQAPWGYLTTAHPGQDLGYSGLAYLGAQKFDLSTSPALPNLSYEVQALGPFAADGLNVNPADVIEQITTNTKFGADFPLAALATLDIYRAYCNALGLWVSPIYNSQRTASQILTELTDLTNSVPIWNGSTLDIIPRGDEAVSGNGASYTPPSSPLFDLTDDDFVDQGANAGPLQVLRARPSDALNAIVFEYMNNTIRYATDVVEAKDQARIDLYGLRTSGSVQAHLFTVTSIARLAAQLWLQRQLIRNVYSFRLDERYMLLEPMDIVTVTDPDLGITKQWVRIMEITEGPGYFDIVAEEYLGGTGTAALYSVSPSTGYNVDYNATAGNVNPPLFFEPTDALAGQLEVFIAASGATNWGGCDVYVSTDGTSYTLMGRIFTGARMGVLTAPLPTIAAVVGNTTLDATNTLSVDISEAGTSSDNTLISVSTADAQALATACFVDGEYIAFRDAVLTGPGQYNLSFLERGAYGTTPGAHAAGSSFCRIDSTLLAIPFSASQVGTTLTVKLPSFNPFGGGMQSLADVPAYPYTIVGTALASPLPNVTNFRTVFKDNITEFDWDEVTDFRAVVYEIRKGASFSSGQSIGTFAHPPVPSYGDGTYWIAAKSQTGSIVAYSATPASLTITNSFVLENTVATSDEAASGFSGTLGGSAVIEASSVRTTAAGDLTLAADVTLITDVTNYGGQGVGTYEIPLAHEIGIGASVKVKISITWQSAGVPVGANVLTLTDYLGTADFLNSSTGNSVSVYPEIAISQDGVTFGPWQRYSPGNYVGALFKARMQLIPLDPAVIAYLTAFTFTVDLNDATTTLAHAAHGGI